jgi:Tfp pilus assembly protein PilO
MTSTRKWSVLTVVLIIAVFVASWFFLISPKRSKASSLKAQTVTQDQANARLQEKIKELIAQQQDLPHQAARLAEIRRQIPDNPALPALIRDLSSAAKRSGLSLESLAPSEPVAVIEPAAAVAAPVATSTTDAGSTESAPVTVAPKPVVSLYQVPILVRARGSYFEVEAFLNKIEGLRRSFLVTGFSLKPMDTTAASSGLLEINVTGRVFLSPAQAAAAVNPAAVVPTAPAK